ncbi:MAG: SDR family NAD(P)-dependent oxidoreductase [Hyperionvirus sp.]|uniref:SDR family NAD(P)-dependent oxidoreductase n=1 Tax=Hyperionvirus sp. TaxID=2487770 RepID=A0A3G5A691_9VIRU|nr:MAG: SDR family NAD(P)-dependent oxidoreductase [Hyperionvirus sp.]
MNNFEVKAKSYKFIDLGDKGTDLKEKCNFPDMFPAQHQERQPGLEYLMNPLPIFDNPKYKGSGKLKGRVALVTGGDSGIGRAVCVAFAKEGAEVAIAYLYEDKDAELTKSYIEGYGSKCLLIKGDLTLKGAEVDVIKKVLDYFGSLDVLVLNHGVQFPQHDIRDISDEQLELTFKTNIISYFKIVRAAIPYLKNGAAIVCTASITAYEGPSVLIDYASTKGAVVSFVRALSHQLVGKGIRVNAVGPGPVWTSLIVSSYSADYVKTFGTDTPMKRAGQPYELAPTYVYLACDDSSFVTGQVLHVNGGKQTSS